MNEIFDIVVIGFAFLLLARQRLSKLISALASCVEELFVDQELINKVKL